MNALKIQFIRAHVIATNAIVDTKLIRWIERMLPTLPIIGVAVAAINRIPHWRSQRREIRFQSIQWIIYFWSMVNVMADALTRLCSATPTQNNAQTMNPIKSIRSLILMKLMIFVNDTQTSALAHWIVRSPEFNYVEMWNWCHRLWCRRPDWIRWEPTA